MRFDTLDELGKRYSVDKQFTHDYLKLYEDLFLTFRFKRIRLFEIGFFQGHSAKMFAEYFPEGLIHVLDCNSSRLGYLKNFPDEFKKRIIPHQGDQGNREDIRKVLKQIKTYKSLNKRWPKEFQIVVDDGSHQPEHQIVSFEELWPSVIAGGVYIIEDLHAGYKSRQHDTIDYFMEKVHNTNIMEKVHKHNKEMREKIDIESISFPRNLIVIKKKES